MQRETLVDRNSSRRDATYERNATARRVRLGQGYSVSWAMRQTKTARDTAACFRTDIGAFNAMFGRGGKVSWKVRWLHGLKHRPAFTGAVRTCARAGREHSFLFRNGAGKDF
jgi:hypothetical protein